MSDDAPAVATVVVLDRIEPGVTPPYCCHGRVTCPWGCGEWLWLGHATFAAVMSGAVPICHECAVDVIPPGTGVIGNLRDHLRSDVAG